MTPKRVVLDTNVVLMPLTRTTSNDSWIVRVWQTGYIVPLISDETERELIDTLRKPVFNLREDEVCILASVYLDYCVKVEIPEPPPETPQCDDPSDQKFLSLAYQAKADAFVSNDGRVLALKELSEVPILSPGEFIRITFHS